MASKSSTVRVVTGPAECGPPLLPPPLAESRILEPEKILSILEIIVSLVPCPMATTMMRAKTPMNVPSIMKKVRNRCRAISLKP
jgi:hypothetical protein